MRSEQGSDCSNLFLMKISSLDPKNILLRDQRVVKMHLFFMRKFIGYPYTAGYGGIQEYCCPLFMIDSFVHDWFRGDLNCLNQIPIISASCQNFLDPSSKKVPPNENVGILYLKVIIKFSFFKISTPPPLLRKKAELHRFC